MIYQLDGHMKVALQYGSGDLLLDLPADRITIIEPRQIQGLPDEMRAFREAVRKPYGSRPLHEVIQSTDKVAIVIPDGTRAMPRQKLLNWMFEEIDHVPSGNITIINGTGTHRANTTSELVEMLGVEICNEYTVTNHDALDESRHVEVGKSRDGLPVKLNRDYVEADKRIVLGFIEPHFWAGFSGGYKGVFPAIANMDAIMNYHRASIVADRGSTWGQTEGNPTLDQVRHNGSLLQPDFLINVTLNRAKAITGYFCGETGEAHAAGCQFAKRTAMIGVDRPFPIVLTSNSGYPLDQNLYQTVKGISAASQIVEPGGYILAVSECRDGYPEHGNFKKVLLDAESPEAVLAAILEEKERFHDQWQIQALAQYLINARVGLKSSLSPDETRQVFMEPVDDPAKRILMELQNRGPEARVAILPEGPQTIPYVL